ncbi:hypothetical protein BST55_22165 [Vibrio vulnificus]|nr:hypothetical protein [Vibrio parahaemolyticus]OZS53445.1 hypothetical protein BST51_10905 [Vibrio vulnificus]EGR3159728.1 hypothetical protein [Vibrio parahaemolyticus]ODX75608.1 hypothetical protein BBM11_05920 [Vibrio parahaemolyticus]ODX79934.1 hypothetical protein BBM10_00855 [Vibrio parahaemolyticus]
MGHSVSSLEEIRYAAISYTFVIIPFLALVLVKGFTGQWGDLLTTSDWAIASAMIYSSSIITVRSAAKEHRAEVNDISLDWFMSKTLIMAVISVILYVLVLLVPSTPLGITQILLFVYSSLSHFRIARAVYRLKNT